MAQIRQNLTEYAVLPLGCDKVRADTSHIRSILLYGPKGAGKTMLAQAVANETGALFLNISPRNIDGKFPDKKNGHTKLIHMVFKVAIDPVFAPVVIYIDEVDKVLSGGGGKKKKAGAGGDASNRIKKDLQAYTMGCLEQVSEQPPRALPLCPSVFGPDHPASLLTPPPPPHHTLPCPCSATRSRTRSW